jgi:hypothetical protein
MTTILLSVMAVTAAEALAAAVAAAAAVTGYRSGQPVLVHLSMDTSCYSGSEVGSGPQGSGFDPEPMQNVFSRTG